MPQYVHAHNGSYLVCYTPFLAQPVGIRRTFAYNISYIYINPNGQET
jgi:hypothetical protein